MDLAPVSFHPHSPCSAISPLQRGRCGVRKRPSDALAEPRLEDAAMESSWLCSTIDEMDSEWIDLISIDFLIVKITIVNNKPNFQTNPNEKHDVQWASDLLSTQVALAEFFFV